MKDPHCKIGKVTKKNNLVVLENPLDAWSKEAVQDASGLMKEVQKDDGRVDAIIVYMHFSNDEALVYLNRNERCAISSDLLGEVVKTRVNSLRSKNDAREVMYELLED